MCHPMVGRTQKHKVDAISWCTKSRRPWRTEDCTGCLSLQVRASFKLLGVVHWILACPMVPQAPDLLSLDAMAISVHDDLILDVVTSCFQAYYRPPRALSP